MHVDFFDFMQRDDGKNHIGADILTVKKRPSTEIRAVVQFEHAIVNSLEYVICSLVDGLAIHDNVRYRI